MIPSGYHTHDGAYGRFALGFGGVSGSASGQKYSGTSFAVAVAGGTAITESLILYLEFLAHGIPHPRFEGNGGWTATAARASGLGPGVAYYFMPLNLYLSGTFLYQLLDFGGVQWDLSHPLSLGASGVGCSLMVGKEWWVSANWGLGAAAQLLLGESTGASADGRWTAKALAIMFSSTYN
jgi:hypothetical protein